VKWFPLKKDLLREQLGKKLVFHLKIHDVFHLDGDCNVKE
jgi:hypothetical protein